MLCLLETDDQMCEVLREAFIKEECWDNDTFASLSCIEPLRFNLRKGVGC